MQPVVRRFCSNTTIWEKRVPATYLLPCQCGGRVRVTSSQAGELLQCAACGASLTAPTLRTMRQLEVVKRPPGRRNASRWGARKIWIVLGLYLAAGALITLAVLWARRPTPPDASKLSPLESWQVWMALRQGLNRRVSWYTGQLIESQNSLRLHTYICLGAAVLGIAISLLAFVFRKRRAVYGDG